MIKLKLILFCSFVLLSGSYLNAQTEQTSGIHSIFIFEYHGGGFIEIMADGKTSFGDTIDLKVLNKKIEKHLKSVGYRMIGSNNEPPPPVNEPKLDAKNTYIMVILNKDFIKDQGFANPTMYKLEYNDQAKSFFDYHILQLLSPEDSSKIINYLKAKS